MVATLSPVLSSATLTSTPEAVVLMVGVGERLALLCTAAALDLGLRPRHLRHVDALAARLRAEAPDVVVVPGASGRRVIEELAAVAREIGAELVILPSVVGPAQVAHAIARGAAALDSRRRRL